MRTLLTLACLGLAIQPLAAQNPQNPLTAQTSAESGVIGTPAAVEANYSVTKAELKINENKTLIKLKLHIDTRYGSVMDYFEIFMQRMILCRKAAEKLGLQFKLMINEQQLI